MLEEVIPISVEARHDESFDSFDPLVDLYGLWTTDLADRYLPIEGAPPAKYECRSIRSNCWICKKTR